MSIFAIIVAFIVCYMYSVITDISGSKAKKSNNKRSYSGYSGNGSYSSPGTSSSSYDSTPKEKPAPKDANEGYYVTGYNAYGASERRDSFGLTTQKKNEFGNWENV